MIVASCRCCGGHSLQVETVQTDFGTVNLGICNRCDRRRCGHCRVPVGAFDTRCPHCGANVGLVAPR